MCINDFVTHIWIHGMNECMYICKYVCIMYICMYVWGGPIIEFRGGGGTNGYYTTGATYKRTICMGEIFFEIFCIEALYNNTAATCVTYYVTTSHTPDWEGKSLHQLQGGDVKMTQNFLHTKSKAVMTSMWSNFAFPSWRSWWSKCGETDTWVTQWGNSV